MSIADQYERYMLELINAERAKVGAPTLQLEQNLNDAADAHSEWMLQVDEFSHTGVDGSSPTKRIRDAQFDLSGGWRTAENIAVQSERGPDGIMDDVADLHTSLMNSPGHRANILNPDLDYIGIGIALGDFDFSSGTYESVIVTQNFASTGGNVDLDLGFAPAPAAVAVVAPEPAAIVVEKNVQAELIVEDTPPPAPVPQQPTVQDTPDTLSPETVVPVAATPAAAVTFSGLLADSGLDLFEFLVRDAENANNGPILFGGLSAEQIAEETVEMTKDTFYAALQEFEIALQQAATQDLDGLAI